LANVRTPTRGKRTEVTNTWPRSFAVGEGNTVKELNHRFFFAWLSKHKKRKENDK
jgi:hypothetical protein